ncbi:MAG: hypothetical protein ACKO5K_04665 [Armatimonadota bacterium]
MHDEIARDWIPTEEGATIGAPGPEGGRVLADSEWADPEDPEDADARLTIESADEGFRVIGQLYGGWFHRIECFPSLAAAETGAEWFRATLERLAGMIPYEEDRDVPRKVRELIAAAESSLTAPVPGA